MIRVIFTTLVISLAFPAYTEEQPATYSYKSMSVELAAKAARHALLDCRKRGYSVAVAEDNRGQTTVFWAKSRFY